MLTIKGLRKMTSKSPEVLGILRILKEYVETSRGPYSEQVDNISNTRNYINSLVAS